MTNFVTPSKGGRGISVKTAEKREKRTNLIKAGGKREQNDNEKGYNL